MLREDYGEQILDALMYCYSAGTHGEACPVRLDFHTEMEALSRKTGRPLEQLRANQGVWRLFILACRAYDMGAESRASKENREDYYGRGKSDKVSR